MRIRLPISFACREHRNLSLKDLAKAPRCWRCDLRATLWTAHESELNNKPHETNQATILIYDTINALCGVVHRSFTPWDDRPAGGRSRQRTEVVELSANRIATVVHKKASPKTVLRKHTRGIRKPIAVRRKRAVA